MPPPPHSININSNSINSINKTDNLNNSNTINNPTANNNTNTTSNQNQTESLQYKSNIDSSDCYFDVLSEESSIESKKDFSQSTKKLSLQSNETITSIHKKLDNTKDSKLDSKNIYYRDYDLSKSLNNNHLDSINDLDELCSLTCKNENLDSNIDNNSFTKHSNISNHNISNKQTYPPLLNPKEVDYSTIDSNIALELRLPPKANYKFVFIKYSLSGSLALQMFFEKCGIYPCEYQIFFKNISYKNIYFDIQRFHTLEVKQDSKKLYCTAQQDNIIILVRDPISRLKTLINHGWYVENRYNFDFNFTINEDPYRVVNRKGYHNEHYIFTSNKPFITNGLLEFFFSRWTFDYNTAISHLSRYTDITYLDMQEIMPDKAFDTMTRLAKKFNFTLPNEKDKDFYTAIRFNETFYILPLVCVIDLNNNQKVKIHIVSKQQESNVSININRIIFSTDNPLLEKVSFSMSEYDLKALQEDKETLDKVKTYMQDFLIELQKRTDYIKRNKKHENDVLEIFRGDRDLCKKFKAMLDKELIHIKTHRPDIVASWKYYQEFEKICKEGSVYAC